MRVLISEFLVGGAATFHESTASMRREGMEMLRAITKDVSRIPGHCVVTTLAASLPNLLECEVIPVEDPIHEKEVFQSMLKQVDAVLIVAPETGGVLAERCRNVRSAGTTSWNCTPTSIDLCGDKSLLAGHLKRKRLPTIPTRIANLNVVPDDERWPIVLKPIDGAGSTLTFLVQNRDQWNDAVETIRASRETDRFVIQPYIAGKPLSVGVNISFDGRALECLAIGEQRISNDGRLCYLGGIIPADLSPAECDRIKELVVNTCRSIPGLAGYVGVDLILTDRSHPIIVEINPRLTTAYVGYRARYSASIPERWLSSSEKPLAAFQKPELVKFQCEEF